MTIILTSTIVMRAFITFQFIIISLNQVQKYINMGWWHNQHIIVTFLHWQTQRLNSAKGYLSEIFCAHKIFSSMCAIKYSFLYYSFKMYSFRRNIYDFIILIFMSHTTQSENIKRIFPRFCSVCITRLMKSLQQSVYQM